MHLVTAHPSVSSHTKQKETLKHATLLTSRLLDGSFLFPSSATDHHRMGFGVTMAFMIIALCMAFVLRYTLAKYPYPELPSSGYNASDDIDGKGDMA